MRFVYLDNAATTRPHPKVLKAMEPFLDEGFGNPSSFHRQGKDAKDAIEAARESIAKILSARPSEIVFTSGGTEANNLAILGVARSAGKGHLIISAIEHPSVLEAATHLQKKENFDLTILPVDHEGLVSPHDLEEALREDTILVSVMLANNEIGTIEPIEEIGKIILKQREKTKSNYPLFHTDACQAAGVLGLSVESLHVDLMTVNSSKIYGPKGAGFLYIRRGIKLTPLMFGGAQEKGLRPGTENVAALVGLARALEIAEQEKKKESARLITLRDKLIKNILSTIPKTRLNGHPTKRLPNNVNISFMDLEGEALLLYLDAKGIYASTGSACTSVSLDPSHVILALGYPYEVAHGSIRFTLGRTTSDKDIDYVLKTIPPLVEKLRSISPVRVDEKYYA